MRRTGVRVVLDDFGTGYSSLSCLHEIPLDGIKIDRSFIATIGEDRLKTLVTWNVITLAHSLGLRVVGEGVERDEQLARLRDMGCDHAQGFLLGRPVEADAFAAFLRERSLQQ